MNTGVVFNIMKYSIHDGPGIRTTVFLKGCPLSCWWCHNPESQRPVKEILQRQERCIGCKDCLTNCAFDTVSKLKNCTLCGNCTDKCPSGAREMVGQVMTVKEVMAEINKDLIFYEESGGGATFSGGEPLMQPDFLLEVLHSCKKAEIHAAIETTGFAKYEILQRVSEITDLFLYDLKLLDEFKHKKYTGVSNKLILENLQRLAKVHPNVTVRIPIIPGINDDSENIESTGRFLYSVKNIKEINILPYHNGGVEKYKCLKRNYLLQEVLSPGEERMQEIAYKLNEFGFKVKIGG